jgi:hypothetical protein
MVGIVSNDTKTKLGNDFYTFAMPSKKLNSSKNYFHSGRVDLW